MIALSRIAAVCGLSLLASGLAHAEDWKLAKDEDGIKIYLSEVQGSKYKAYRGVTTIKADVATLRTLQEDVKGSCQWIHACAEQSLLKHGFAGVQGVLNLVLGGIDQGAGLWAFLGGELAKGLHQGGQFALLAEILDPELLQGVHICGALHGLKRLRDQCIQVFHVRTPDTK